MLLHLLFSNCCHCIYWGKFKDMFIQLQYAICFSKYFLLCYSLLQKIIIYMGVTQQHNVFSYPRYEVMIYNYLMQN